MVCIGWSYYLIEFTNEFLKTRLPIEVETVKNIRGVTVKVSVYYESDCPSCREFFKDQLLPTWKLFRRFIDLDLIPYGKASQTRDIKGRYNFECQHGPDECFRNMIQACALDKLWKSAPTTAFNFIACYMPKEDKKKYGKKCARRYKIDFKELKKCANSDKGRELLAKLGNRTHEFKPQIKWVPTIVFNDVFSQEDTDDAASDLKKVICRKLNKRPHHCKKNLS